MKFEQLSLEENKETTKKSRVLKNFNNIIKTTAFAALLAFFGQQEAGASSSFDPTLMKGEPTNEKIDKKINWQDEIRKHQDGLGISPETEFEIIKDFEAEMSKIEIKDAPEGFGYKETLSVLKGNGQEIIRNSKIEKNLPDHGGNVIVNAEVFDGLAKYDDNSIEGTKWSMSVTPVENIDAQNMIKVTSEGKGLTQNEALSDAIMEAIATININVKNKTTENMKIENSKFSSFTHTKLKASVKSYSITFIEKLNETLWKGGYRVKITLEGSPIEDTR